MMTVLFPSEQRTILSYQLSFKKTKHEIPIPQEFFTTPIISKQQDMDTKLATKAPYWCKFIEALPCILAPVTTFIWIFFISAPSSSVGATWLWLLPIILSTTISLVCLSYLGRVKAPFPELRFSLYRITEAQRAKLDAIRVDACAVSSILQVCSGCWAFIRGLSSLLTPLGGLEPDIKALEVELWFEIGLFMLGCVLFGILCIGGILLAVGNVADRLAETEKKSRKFEEEKGLVVREQRRECK